MGADTEQAPASQCSQNWVQARPRMSRAGLTSRVGTKGKAEAYSQGCWSSQSKAHPSPQAITSLPQPHKQKPPTLLCQALTLQADRQKPHTPPLAASWEAFTSKSTGDCTSMNTSVRSWCLGEGHRKIPELSDFSLTSKNTICQDKYSFAEIEQLRITCVDHLHANCT